MDSWLSIMCRLLKRIPKIQPGDMSVTDLLIRKEADAMLNIASDPGAHFPNKAVERMAEIPLIAIEPHRTPTTELANIILPPAIAGVECEGTAYRMDGVPIELKKSHRTPRRRFIRQRNHEKNYSQSQRTFVIITFSYTLIFKYHYLN